MHGETQWAALASLLPRPREIALPGVLHTMRSCFSKDAFFFSAQTRFATLSACRCKTNQENTPDLADHKVTPTRGTPHRAHSSIARSPLSSITSPAYPASAIADPETGYICMHTNMLALSTRRSSTPCLDSRYYDQDMASTQLEPNLVSYDDCPKTPDSCHTVAKQV